MDRYSVRAVDKHGTSHVSPKKNDSMQRNWDFKRAALLNPECDSESLKSNNSIYRILDFKRSAQEQPLFDSGYTSSSTFRDWNTDVSRSKLKQPGHDGGPLDSIFVSLEENIIAFVKKELNKFHRILASDYPELLENEQDKEQKCKEAFLQITQDFLRKMQLEELADLLQIRSLSGVYQRKLKSTLKLRYCSEFGEGFKTRDPTLLSLIDTELYITEGESAVIRHIETFSRRPATPGTTMTCADIFKAPGHRPIRTVLTMGVANIGKTVLTQKFSVDWAESRANQDVQLLFPFTFRELNVLRASQFSLMELLQHFFSESAGHSLDKLHLLFIFDGLDECTLPLDFTQTRVLTTTTESVSVDVLLVNLIRGDLLPSARLWITTRPTAANQIPAEYISLVTEVRGFTDTQKKQYFKERFRDEQQASAIISHIKTSPSLQLRSHVPVFCWIFSTVLEHVMETRAIEPLPHTFTQLYIQFLKSLKYNRRSDTDTWTPDTRRMVETLGKLAFEQLQEKKQIFYLSDLHKCGLDPIATSKHSRMFTQLFREEPGLHKDMVYCFIHVNIQAFLAALHVHATFYSTGTNLLLPQQTYDPEKSKDRFYRVAIQWALKSPDGHWDLFLQFLLGLSLPANQRLLQGLLPETQNAAEEIVAYIKLIINDSSSSERVLTLFHCLNELNDSSLLHMMQDHLKSGHFSKRMSPAQWSALAFILLCSEKDLDIFELKKYQASEEVLLRLLPVVKASSKAKLAACNLGKESSVALSSVLSSKSTFLKDLDLSYNSLKDSGVQLLAVGLQAPHCTLHTLSTEGEGETGPIGMDLRSTPTKTAGGLLMGSCGTLSAVMAGSPSLRYLDLSNNDLMDSGVEQLCVGLGSPDCKLQSLRLSGCMLSAKASSALKAALQQNPSFLKELDLSYNYIALPALNLMSSVEGKVHLKDVRLTPCGEQFLKPGQRKYFCELSLDPNTAYRKLNLSDDNRTVIFVEEEQLYPDHVDRFDWYPQVMCSTGLTGRHYWEVEWSGVVSIAVSYREIPRKGNDTSIMFGQNSYSWRFWCSDGRLSVCENKEEKFLDMLFSERFGRVGVFLDCIAGFLSFYRVLDGQPIHLYTFHTNFTEPLFAGFGFGSCFSSVTLISK